MFPVHILIIHLCGLQVVLGARGSAVKNWPQQNQLSSSDTDFAEVPAANTDNWIDDASSPVGIEMKYHPTPSKGYSSSGVPYYYADEVPNLVHRPTNKMYTSSQLTPQQAYSFRKQNSAGGQLHLPEYQPKQHVIWSSINNEVKGTSQPFYGMQLHNGHISDIGDGSLYRQSWGKYPETNEFKLRGGGWGWSSPQQHRPRDGGHVNYAAVSLLGLLALMGTIQHVMSDLDSAMSSSSQSQSDFETAMSITGSRPRPPPRPLRPTIRPPFGSTNTSRPVPPNMNNMNNMNRPIALPMMPNSSKPLKLFKLKYHKTSSSIH